MKLLGITLSVIMILHSSILRIAEQKVCESDPGNESWITTAYSRSLLGNFLVPEQASITKVFQKNTQEKIPLLGIDFFQASLFRILTSDYCNINDHLLKRTSPLFIKLLNLRL